MGILVTKIILDLTCDLPSALLRWTIAGPELSRVIREFQDTMPTNSTGAGSDIRHHDQSPAVQTAFQKDVKQAVRVLEEWGSPFLEEGQDLYVLDTKNVVDQKVINTVRNIEQFGRECYNSFVSERIEKQEKNIMHVLSRNSLPLFSTSPPKITKAKTQMSSLKSDCSMFSKLYIALQTRDGDINTFFKHENGLTPPSLCDDGMMFKGTKSDIVPLLESTCPPVNTQTTLNQSPPSPKVEALIIDGAVVVNLVAPDLQMTFEEYALKKILPHVTKLLEASKSTRADVIWDVYIEHSLKALERLSRGAGQRKKVMPKTKTPRNWHSFLRVNENKTELFTLLGKELTKLDDQKLVISTAEQNVLSNKPEDCTDLMPCTHEEADMRLYIHAADMSKKGFKKVMIRSVDSDIVVLAVSIYQEMEFEEMWVEYGVGKNKRFVSVHSIASSIGPFKCRALPLFHAITGCDTVSAFKHKGKKTAWDTWKVYPDLTPALLSLMDEPAVLDDSSSNCFAIIERFVILMYNRTSEAFDINIARKELFANCGGQIDKIPPTKAALMQHLKRAVYQGSVCWGHAVNLNPVMPNPSTWGWVQRVGVWHPFWTELAEASAACREFLLCGCRQKCKASTCTCMKAGLKCTGNCKFCRGNCA